MAKIKEGRKGTLVLVIEDARINSIDESDGEVTLALDTPSFSGLLDRAYVPKSSIVSFIRNKDDGPA